jgi:hypothetical protein
LATSSWQLAKAGKFVGLPTIPGRLIDDVVFAAHAVMPESA